MRTALRFALYGAIGGLILGIGIVVFRYWLEPEQEPVALWQIEPLQELSYGGGSAAPGSADHGGHGPDEESPSEAEHPSAREQRDQTLGEVAVFQASLNELTEAYKTIHEIQDDRARARALEYVALDLLRLGMRTEQVDGQSVVQKDQIVRLIDEIKKVDDPAERSRTLSTLVVYLGDYGQRVLPRHSDEAPTEPMPPSPAAAADGPAGAERIAAADTIPLMPTRPAGFHLNGGDANRATPQEGAALHRDTAKGLVEELTDEEVESLKHPLDRARLLMAASRAMLALEDEQASRAALKSAAIEARKAPTAQWSVWRIWTWPIALAALGTMLFGLLGHAFHALFHGLTVGMGETIYHEVTRRMSTPTH